MKKLTLKDLINFSEFVGKDLDDVWIEDGLVYVDGGHFDGRDFAPNVYTVKEVRHILGLE